jgi:hypothetical protein
MFSCEARCRPATGQDSPALSLETHILPPNVKGRIDHFSVIDNHSGVIVGVQATAARMSPETVAAQDMIARFARWQGRGPVSVAADTTYGNGEFLQWLAEITPYIRTRDSAHRKKSPFYGPEHFTYLPESNSYRCPAGQPLNHGGRNARNRTHLGTRQRCGACSQFASPKSSSRPLRCTPPEASVVLWDFRMEQREWLT